MDPIIAIRGLTKRYARGPVALDSVDLEIRRGEIFALLGPNGAGKTTLIQCICGLVTPTEGEVRIDGHDILRDARAARAKVGLVPQELATDIFETPWATVNFSRGLFGRAPNRPFVEGLLKELALWEKRDAKIMTLSGGMKRRVMIAKALSHEPEVLFLDEPTAGVDVKLRREMWRMVRALRDRGVTIILTTHYLEEAEDMADRIGVINKGKLVVVDEKPALMKRLGKRRLSLTLQAPLAAIPSELQRWQLSLSEDRTELSYTFDADRDGTDVPALLQQMTALGIGLRDLHSEKSSLEEIFVRLVDEEAA